MSTARPYVKLGQRILAFAAAAFGLATVVAGGRVLAGADPGYVVFRPLVIFNTAMGVAYLAAGIITLRSLKRGKFAAATTFLLNLLVLGAIGYLYAAGSAVAIDSIRAMTFRTGVWLVLFLGLAWLGRGSHAPGTFQRQDVSLQTHAQGAAEQALAAEVRRMHDRPQLKRSARREANHEKHNG